MAKQNQGYRKDLNLDETTVDTQALNNLGGAGIAGDLRIIQNNLRNTSSLAYSSNSNGFFTFPESVEAIFTNDDVVSVGTTVSIGSTTSSFVNIASTDSGKVKNPFEFEL